MSRHIAWTLESRRALAAAWADGMGAVEIARRFGRSPSTIYAELKRGHDGTLDNNSRPRYDADRGQTAFQASLRNRGRRPTENAQGGRV